MKGLLTLSVIIGFASMSAATSIETDRMNAGIKFNEQIMEAKIDNSKVAPVQMNIELTKVEDAQYNAEAKNFSRLTAKAPAALIAAKSDVEKKDGKTEKKRVIVNGLKVAGILLLVGGVIAVCSGSIVAGAIAAGIIFCGGVLMS